MIPQSDHDNGRRPSMRWPKVMATHNNCKVSWSLWKDNKVTKDILELNSQNRADMKELEQVTKDVEATLKDIYPDCKIWRLGSVVTGSAVEGSDVDYSVYIPQGTDQTSIHEKLEALRDSIRKKTDSDNNPVFDYVTLSRESARIQLLELWHGAVKVDITLDNYGAIRNTQFQIWYGQIDPRVQQLCQAVKIWAKKVSVIGAQSRYLNCFSYCLMVIFYLQTVGILPNIQAVFPNLEEEIELTNPSFSNITAKLDECGIVIDKNESSIGALFYGFMKFYSEFNFYEKYISVKHGKTMDRIFEKGHPFEKHFIVIEDPFIDWNCARSVNDIGFEHIQYAFLKAEHDLRTAHNLRQIRSVILERHENDGREIDNRVYDLAPRVHWRLAGRQFRNSNRTARASPTSFYDDNWCGFGYFDSRDVYEEI